MYNTGDLGSVLPNGEIEHLGRVDDQVKIKGFRVELDGVATCISQCSGVTASAALFVADRKELWGFYTPSSVRESDVRAAVARVQPYYAVPRCFLGLETMPLTRFARSVDIFENYGELNPSFVVAMGKRIKLSFAEGWQRN